MLGLKRFSEKEIFGPEQVSTVTLVWISEILGVDGPVQDDPRGEIDAPVIIDEHAHLRDTCDLVVKIGRREVRIDDRDVAALHHRLASFPFLKPVENHVLEWTHDRQDRSIAIDDE